ncbi:FxDxF family PEP-CTERM protein [Aquabacterium sp.]|uniref:FxDxF family PEP-CTERM protein n=1 Tax=Aquabacterium sp. TaxID=1872578 RepID=UPI0025C18048|nr:FxDxF family PEP-CTERM protein [Aquabacterium sp.]
MKSIFLASVLGLAALGNASATILTSTTELDLMDDTAINIGNTFSKGNAGNSFSDLYNFELSLAGDQDAIVELAWTTGATNSLAHVIATLTSENGVEYIDNDLSDAYSFTGLTAGFYKLTITGDILGSKTSSYGGYFSLTPVTPAVPEPESLALALAGLGVAGLLARRRSH